MSRLIEDMGWGERLAVVQHFGLNDKQAATAFKCSTDEVVTARELANAGTISVASNIDFDQYADELSVKKAEKNPTATTTKKAAKTSSKTAETATPVTATKPQKEAKKRGRKGDKIKNAFASIPSTPVNAEEYIAQHQISMNVLRQGKRFDNSGLEGTVHVRKNKDTGVLMVWREVK